MSIIIAENELTTSTIVTVWFYLNYNEACKAWTFTIGIAKLFKEVSMCERKRTDRKLNVANLVRDLRNLMDWLYEQNLQFTFTCTAEPQQTLVIHPSEKFW